MLVFKIDAVDGKKWTKFVAMQQTSVASIYDLNTMKDTEVKSYTLKNCTAIQNSTVPTL